jgi:glutamyl-tRNA synthetase
MYLRQKDDAWLAGELNATLNDSSLSEKIVKLMKERVTFTKEMIAEVPYLFEDIKAYDEEISQKKWDELAKTAMPVVVKILEGVSDFISTDIHDALFAGLEAEGIKPGKIMQALRLALTGEGKGPDLMLTVEILGKEKSISRIQKALSVL